MKVLLVPEQRFELRVSLISLACVSSCRSRADAFPSGFRFRSVSPLLNHFVARLRFSARNAEKIYDIYTILLLEIPSDALVVSSIPLLQMRIGSYNFRILPPMTAADDYRVSRVKLRIVLLYIFTYLTFLLYLNSDILAMFLAILENPVAPFTIDERDCHRRYILFSS